MNLSLFDTATESRITNSHEAQSYTGVYGMHKYWGKKPFNVMAKFIERFTEKGNIVLDPFCGSGVSISEAVFNQRKGLGVDINPSSILITENILRSIDLKIARQIFHSIESSIKDKINGLYMVKRKDGYFVGENFLWEDSALTEIRFSKGAKVRVVEEPTTDDVEHAMQITYDKINLPYPKDKFFHNSRINANGSRNVYELFTPRNLYALALLRQEIEMISNPDMKEFFLFCFTASLGQASKMVFVIKRRTGKNMQAAMPLEKKEVGSWVIGYWMPKDFFENNVWTCFVNRFTKILKAKKIQSDIRLGSKKATNFLELSNADYLLVNQPAQTFLTSLPDHSIDYILTDPPHGNRIPYLELSLLWNSWLRRPVFYEDEIIVSESRDRNKNIDSYNRLMAEVIKECYRVLKPNKYLSFMFNSLDDKAWIHSVEMFYENGFELCQVETMSYSANSVVQDNRKNGLQTDFIITYKKSDYKGRAIKLEVVDITNNAAIIQRISSLKQLHFKPYEIMNQVFSELLTNNQFVRITQLLKQIENA